MTILARVKSSWPVVVQGTGGVTVSQSNGRALIGFDYTSSEVGASLDQAIDNANAAANTAIAAAASIPGKATDEDMDAAVDDKYTTPEKNIYIIVKNKKYIDIEDKGAILDGMSSSASVNAQAASDAVSAALSSGTRRIIIPTGGIMYIDDALASLTATKGIEICGYGSSSGQSTFATRIIYTPSSGSLIRLNNCQSITFRHLSLYYSAADYSGTFIDLRGTLAANTSFILFDDFEIGGTNSSSKNALLVDVSNSYKTTLNNGYIRNGYYGVVGARESDKSDFCNKTLINDVEFDAALQVPVVAGGMNFEVNSCVFEPPKGASGGLDAIMVSPWGVVALKVAGTQFADAGASAGSWINLESSTDFGAPGTIQTIDIDANAFQCGSHATSGFAVDLGAAKGGSVTNNYFNRSTDIGFIIHNGASGIIVEGNTPHSSGGPGTGKIWASVDYPTGLSRVADTQGDGFKYSEKITLSGASNAHAAINLGPYNGVPTSPVVGDILFNGTTFQWRLSAGWVTAATTNSNLGIFAATTSAQLRGIISDETGTGALVFANSPALVTPDLGVATATSINGAAIDNNAWSTYTPTITANSGTYTTVSAAGRYKQIGKTVICEGTVTTTDIGTGIGATYVTLPVTAKSATAYAGSGYIKSTAAALSVGIFDTDATHIRLYTAAGGTAAANGLLLNFTIIYEAA